MNPDTNNTSRCIQSGDRMLRPREVCARTGLSKSTVYALSAQGKFPRFLKLGARSSGIPESQLNQWMQSRVDLAAGSGASQA